MADHALVWFRRDLRLEDNPAWAEATHRARVTALYVLDPRLLDVAGPFRRAQLLAELHALADELTGHGGRLLVRRGDPTTVVPAEADRLNSTSVHWNADVTPFANRRDAAVRAALSVPTQTPWGTLVHPPGSVLTRKGGTSRVFTAFHRIWESMDPNPCPEAGDAAIGDDPGDGLPPREGDAPQPTGQDAAWSMLERFSGTVDDYDEARDRIDPIGTSTLSVALRFGTISPRRVLEVVGTSTPGRAAFVRQLAWRDWYAHLLHELPELVTRALRPEGDRIAWRDDADGVAAWKEGRTGYPIVDAGMRELATTGWMHNRVRMITASFLTKDLLVDWRVGERHFRRLLLDGDVAQNVGNWQWVAGTGPDAAPYFRILNPVRQSRSYDPEGRYLRRWLPELAGLDDHAIHAPWEVGALGLEAAGVELGVGYPAPILDHPAARERALAAYRTARS